jgi:predicted negative regulator of RcsB-dependent stress response
MIEHMGHRMDRMRMEHGPAMGAFADLHALERLYREAGREKELSGLYTDVLAKSQDPHLRTYVYHQLARLQARPANVDQAIATLRKSLAENLASEAKMQAEREHMHAQWQSPSEH